MVTKYLLLYCFVLVLCLKQSVSIKRDCDKICARWEGDKGAMNGICHRRWKRCMQEQLNLGIRKKNGRNWKRRIVPNLAETIETALRLTKRDEPCVNIIIYQEMDNTMCRAYCQVHLNEKQIETPLEACRADTYCCKLPDRTLNQLELLVKSDLDKTRKPHSWYHVYKSMRWVE